jgi:predicted nucleotidyltransferase
MQERIVKQRQELLEFEVNRIVSILKDQYQPERVILFGSLASGRIHEWSDIDLVVIKKTDKGGMDRILEVSELCKNKVATHFLVYTPEEYERLSSDRTSFLSNEVLSKGRVLYP